MSVPNHRDECTTYIWGTQCRDCYERVYLFGCSCGSVVLFDAPEPPWPKHEDRCIPYLVRRMRTEGYTFGQIEALIERTANYYGVVVPPAAARKLAQEKYKATGETKVYPLKLEAEQSQFVGTIHNVNWQVNLFARLDLPDNVISRGILGRHARIDYAEITIRMAADDLTGLVGELTCFIPIESAKAAKLKFGTRVIAAVRLHRIPGGRQLFICEHLVLRH